MDWENVLAEVIKTILGLVVTVGIPYLISVIKKKTDNEIALRLVDRASEAVETCVNFVNQTYVNALKADGKFDKESQEAAFQMCLEACEETLSEATKIAIEELCGDVEMWLETKIESKVLEQKIFI